MPRDLLYEQPETMPRSITSPSVIKNPRNERGFVSEPKIGGAHCHQSLRAQTATLTNRPAARLRIEHKSELTYGATPNVEPT